MDVLQEARRVRKDVEEWIRDGIPSGQLELDPLSTQVFMIFRRMQSLHDAIWHLVDGRFDVEAWMLSRSLFEDLMRLRELQVSSINRDVLLITWLEFTLKKDREMFQYAWDVGLDENPQQAGSTIKQKLKDLTALRNRRNATQSVRFLDTVKAAKRFGFEEDAWNYLVGHQLVHGAPASHALRLTSTNENEFRSLRRSQNDQLIAGVGTAASKWLLAGYVSTAYILAWENDPKVARNIADAERAIRDL